MVMTIMGGGGGGLSLNCNLGIEVYILYVSESDWIVATG